MEAALTGMEAASLPLVANPVASGGAGDVRSSGYGGGGGGGGAAAPVRPLPAPSPPAAVAPLPTSSPVSEPPVGAKTPEQARLCNLYEESRWDNNRASAKELIVAAKRGDADRWLAAGFLAHLCLWADKGVPHDAAAAAAYGSSALPWLTMQADAGNMYAQFALGVMCDNGAGVARDCTQAARWYRQAAEQGLADAQFNLGGMYANGRPGCVVKDETEAVYWYREAAEQDYAHGQTVLGHMYDNGWGVAKDVKAAVCWYRLAAKQGNAEAIEMLERRGIAV